MFSWLFGAAPEVVDDTDWDGFDWAEAAEDALNEHGLETDCPAEYLVEEPDGDGSLFFCGTCGDELDV